MAGGPGGLCSWRASRWLRGSRAPALRRRELLGRPSGLPLPIRMFPEATQRRHRLGALRASARTEPAGRLTERLLPGSLLDLIKKKKKKFSAASCCNIYSLTPRLLGSKMVVEGRGGEVAELHC